MRLLKSEGCIYSANNNNTNAVDLRFMFYWFKLFKYKVDFVIRNQFCVSILVDMLISNQVIVKL